MTAPISLPIYRPLVIVSRYEAFATVMVQLGYAPDGTPSFAHPHAEDVRGRHVLCDTIELGIAAHATGVSVVPVTLPPDVDSPQAPSALLRRHVGPIETYVVRGSSTALAAEYNGGITSTSSAAARALISEFGLAHPGAEELAEKLDHLFWPERQAGEESEKMYLRLIAAERDRRLAAENQLLQRPAPGKLPTGIIPLPPV